MNALVKLIKWFLIICIGAPVVALVASVLVKTSIGDGSSAPSPTPERTSTPPNGVSVPAAPRDTSRDREVVLKNIVLDHTWTLGGFNTVAVVDFKIKNNNSFAVKDLIASCDAHSKSQTRLGSNKKVIYDVFPAGKAVSIKEFGMGFVNSQTHYFDCQVIGYSID